MDGLLSTSCPPSLCCCCCLLLAVPHCALLCSAVRCSAVACRAVPGYGGEGRRQGGLQTDAHLRVGLQSATEAVVRIPVAGISAACVVPPLSIRPYVAGCGDD